VAKEVARRVGEGEIGLRAWLETRAREAVGPGYRELGYEGQEVCWRESCEVEPRCWLGSATNGFEGPTGQF